MSDFDIQRCGRKAVCKSEHSEMLAEIERLREQISNWEKRLLWADGLTTVPEEMRAALDAAQEGS